MSDTVFAQMDADVFATFGYPAQLIDRNGAATDCTVIIDEEGGAQPDGFSGAVYVDGVKLEYRLAEIPRFAQKGEAFMITEGRYAEKTFTVITDAPLEHDEATVKVGVQVA